VRQKLELGSSFDLTTADWIALKLAGKLADRRVDPNSPGAQASVRMGLPRDFLYRSASEQARLLREAGLQAGESAAA
jgi:hypothetical protein